MQQHQTKTERDWCVHFYSSVYSEPTHIHASEFAPSVICRFSLEPICVFQRNFKFTESAKILYNFWMYLFYVEIYIFHLRSCICSALLYSFFFYLHYSSSSYCKTTRVVFAHLYLEYFFPKWTHRTKQLNYWWEKKNPETFHIHLFCTSQKEWSCSIKLKVEAPVCIPTMAGVLMWQGSCSTVLPTWMK